MSQYTTYRQFLSEEEAAPYIALLNEKSVPHELVKLKQAVSSVIAGDLSEPGWELKLLPEQFETVTRLFEEYTQVDIRDLDKDHYLFSFSETELKEILQKPDEWSAGDYLAAQQVLQQRGITYTPETLQSFREQRMQALAKPERLRSDWMTLAYFCIFLGGFIGILMGLTITRARKVLPDGSKVFTYDQESRQKGRFVMITSTVVFVVFCLTGYIFSVVDVVNMFWTW